MSEDQFVAKEIKSHIVGFREAFDLFDRDGGGNISTAEFLRCWRSFGFQASVEEVEAMLVAADIDGSGEMDFKEFVFMVTQATGEIVGNIQGQLREMREVCALPNHIPLSLPCELCHNNLARVVDPIGYVTLNYV